MEKIIILLGTINLIILLIIIKAIHSKLKKKSEKKNKIKKELNSSEITLVGIKIALVALSLTMICSTIPFILSIFQIETWKLIAEKIVIVFYIISAIIFLYFACKIELPKE